MVITLVKAVNLFHLTFLIINTFNMVLRPSFTILNIVMYLLQMVFYLIFSF